MIKTVYEHIYNKYPVDEEVLESYVEKWDTKRKVYPMPNTTYCPSSPSSS